MNNTSITNTYKVISVRTTQAIIKPIYLNLIFFLRYPKCNNAIPLLTPAVAGDRVALILSGFAPSKKRHA